MARAAVQTVGGAAYLAALLAVDRHATYPQQIGLGVLTWLVLLGALLRVPVERRIQALGVVAFATVGEVTGSLIWGVYHYRLHNLPLFVPPGHGLVYLAAVLVGTSATVTRRPLVPLVVLVLATAWAVGGLALPVHPDTLGALLFVSFAAFILRGRYPGVYTAAFVLTAGLELYGTRLGTWRWAAHDPTGLLSAANPPSGIPGGYCWLDFWALALAPYAYALLVRAGIALRLRPAPAAPS